TRSRLSRAVDAVQDFLSSVTAAPEYGHAPAAPAKDASADLRALAKRQRVDGSWNGSVTETAEALAEFVKHGHTDRNGTFTAQIRRSIEFIERALSTGWTGS